MRAVPIFLNSGGDAGWPLVRVEAIANGPRNEAWLQDLLYTHPELLPVEAFDESYSPAIPIGREVATDRGPIDNLYVSPDGGVTVVETKLWKNPEKHRTVVAQIIDYAKELAAWDYDRFCRAVLTSSRRRGETDKASLEERIAPSLAAAGNNLCEFQEAVAASLSRGAFLLLIVGDRISPNIALLTQAIQSAPGLSFTIGLVEMQLYQLGQGRDWPLIVAPEIVGRTVEKTRGVVRIEYVNEKPKVSVWDDDELGHGGLERFLKEMPPDLRPAVREAVQAWSEVGTIHFTDKMMFFEADIAGGQRIVRCRTYQISVITRAVFEEWKCDAVLYGDYLRALDDAPAVATVARSDKKWIRYDQMSAADLKILLTAARDLVTRVSAL